MKNFSLKKNIQNIINNQDNIKAITKGDIGGHSIEMSIKEPQSFDSYLYKDNLKERNEDFEILINLIPNK